MTSIPNTSTTPAARNRAPRRYRAALVVALLLGALLLAVLVSEAIGWRYLRGPVQNFAAKQLGVEVRLTEPFSLHVLRPPELSLGALWIAAAPGSAAPFLVDGRELRLQWRWRDVMALRRGEALRVKGLEAGSLEAWFTRDAQGHASWAFKPDEPKADKGKTEPPTFDRLQLRAGTVHVDDQPSRLQLEAKFDINEVRRADATPHAAQVQRVALAASQSAAAAPERQAQASGFRVDARGRWRDMPVRASLESPQVLPFVAEGGAPPVQVEARATVGRAQLAYDGTLVDLLGNRQFNGDFRISGPSLGAVGEPLGLTLPSTPAFALQGHLTKTDPVWQATIASATIGSSKLQGEFRYDPQPAVPKLSGGLRGQRLGLADLAPAVGAEPDAAAQAKADGKAKDKAKDKPADGKVLPDKRFDLPSLKAMDADVQVALDEVDLATTALDPLRPLKARVRLDAGVLRIDDLDARTAGGSLAGSTQLDSTATPPRFEADLRWRGVDLAGWLKGARKSSSTVSSTSSNAKLKKERQAAQQGDAPVTAYLTGELQGRAKLKGQGDSTAAILGSLDGQMQALIRDGTISHLVVEAMGIDLAQALGVLVKGDDSLPLRCAAVAFDAKQGVLTPKVALIDSVDSTVSFTGQVDLKQEQLDLRGVVRPRDFSFAALRSPVHVHGSFADPKVGLEVKPIATRLAASAALAFINPLAALLPLFDPGDDPGDGCRALAASAPQADNGTATPGGTASR